MNIAMDRRRRAAQTRMFREAAAAPRVIAAQLEANRERMQALGSELRAARPRALVTCARGSSDHAATYAQYLVATRLGLLTSSAAPSIASLYRMRADLAGTVFVAISQSGASPDLLAAVAAARESGASVLALVNVEASPLAAAADHVIPLCAGRETSVAATKSCLASLAAVIHLTACWAGDDSLLAELRSLPDLLTRAWALEWSDALPVLSRASSCYVIGRGLGLGIALECALKLKETCGLHAEALSAAELQHGPMALLAPQFPVLMLAQHDETHGSVAALAAQILLSGARVLMAGAEAPGTIGLPALRASAAIEPLLLLQSFYRFAAELAIMRGHNPDHPPHLTKITETL